MENTSRDLTLRPVVQRAEEAEGAGGRAPLLQENRPLLPHCRAELQAEPPRPAPPRAAGTNSQHGGRSEAPSLQMLGKCTDRHPEKRKTPNGNTVPITLANKKATLAARAQSKRLSSQSAAESCGAGSQSPLP